MKSKNDKREKIIVALDSDNLAETLAIVEELSQLRISWFKVGKQLFTLYGPKVIDEIRKKSKATDLKIFLDLKYHDIPNTVANAVKVAIHHGVNMLTVHTLGGAKMLEAAANIVAKESSSQVPLLIGVTILTSMSESDLHEVGLKGKLTDHSLRLAKLAKSSGIDGAVCGPPEIKLLRDNIVEPFLLVTPGIRPSFGPKNDQARFLTPKEALELGSNYLVIGRPILAAPDRSIAAVKIIEELNS
ncbi:MAG: orotidine-5'-phosphate decarboxylase [Nitrospinota bacterium]